jgi:hypothetical protein
MIVGDDEELLVEGEVRIPKEFLPRLSARELRDAGYLLEVNRRFFHPLGLALAVDVDEDRIEILDDRGDPEGWYFAELGDEETKAKIVNVTRLELDRMEARRAALGYWIQPPWSDDG